MGKLRGLPQKIGQILSMSGDADRATIFDGLTDGAEPIGFDEIRPMLEAAWGRPLDDVVRSIDERGIAASLGQVHRAELKDGRRVAIKVRYPGIRDAVMNDLKLVGWLSSPVGDLRRGFDLAGYRAEILRDLNEELNYRREAANQNRFAALLADHPAWIVPNVIEVLSGESVLVSEWVDGQRAADLARWDDASRGALGRALVDGFLALLFDHGVVHADPHAGNYRFLRSPDGPRIVLYDFGSVATVDADRRTALLALIDMASRRDGDPLGPLTALGFDARLLGPIRWKLAALTAVLFEPFASAGKYDLSRWRRGERADAILGTDRWNFRLAGPPDLIFLMRAFAGLTHYLDILKTPVCWAAAIAPYLKRDASAIAASTTRCATAAVDTGADAGAAGTFAGMATSLCILVTEGGREKVRVTLPAAAVDGLDDLIDDDLRTKIAAKGIDVDVIVRRAQGSAYAPQELFSLREASREVRVWLA
jgi:predicted unusual protein kinase regulating ubiquinone biosynthesis (AarF/ABC1/UbiB family)